MPIVISLPYPLTPVPGLGGGMDPEFADLVPLFLAEARSRLENLASLAARVAAEPGAAAEARRELHTLKGAARMLRLAPLAELCHAAEGAMRTPGGGTGALLTRVVDRLAAMVEEVAAGADPAADPALLRDLGGPDGSPSTPATGAPPSGANPPPSGPAASAASFSTVASAAPLGPLSSSATSEIRLDIPTVDALADRATRLRILAVGSGTFPQRVTELAHLAEQAVREEQPAQALAVLSTSLRRVAMEMDKGQRQLLRTTESHLESVLSLQVQPLRGFFVSLARHARDLARALGREVDVVIQGEDTRLDRRIVRELEEAVLHVLRNAVDHGVEAPEVRLAAGKPRQGRIRLEAGTAGSRVRIVIADDGAGIDPAGVVKAAVEAGLVEEASARALSRDEALRLLFTAGFSTRREVSEVSGRGVGLDAVAAVVNRVGGSVTLDTQPGAGTRVTLELPLALRGDVITVVRVGRLRLAMPSAAIQRVGWIAGEEVLERGGRVFAQVGDRLVPFVPLHRAFGETPASELLLVEGLVSGQPIAVAVDEIEREEEVLVRPLTRTVEVSPLLEGVALLSSGAPIAVLSPTALSQHEIVRTIKPVPVMATAAALRVLLVDDSLVTREMERRLLEDAGFEVVAAGDAAEALAHLGERPFQCVVTDIEMPGMSGFELTRHVRSIPHLAHLPVVVVSTRDRPDDRLKGLEAGADAYLTKQGLDATELITLVRRLGGK